MSIDEKLFDIVDLIEEPEHVPEVAQRDDVGTAIARVRYRHQTLHRVRRGPQAG